MSGFDERGTFSPNDAEVLAGGKEENASVVLRNVDELAFHEKQISFFEAIESEDYLYLLYGGAIQGGKTTVGLMALFILAKIFPGSRWAVVRKDLPTLKRNTLPVFNRLRPPAFVGEMHRGDWIARCANGSEIIFFPESLDTDKDYDRWKGFLCNGFLFEEANELAETTFHKAQERAGTWKVKGKAQPLPYILLTCNPARNWVYSNFYLPFKQGRLNAPYYFQRALPDDNPHLTQQYRDALKNLPEQARKRFVEGDWDVLDDPDQLISFEWLIAARNTVEHAPGKRHLGVDVARYGDDHTCFVKRDGNGLVAISRHHGLSTTRTGELICAEVGGWPVAAPDVRVDVIGLGAGAVDHCHSQHVNVVGFSSSESAPYDHRYPNFRFKNKRSWAWWHVREELRAGKIYIDPKLDTSRLFQDLASPRYRVKGASGEGQTIELESKDDIKKRIGRSPDEGDAFVMAWAEDPGAYGHIDFSAGRQKPAWKL